MTPLLLAFALGLVPPDDPKPAPKPQAAATLPSPTELFALYRANFDWFHTLTVQWRRDHAYTDASVAHDAREVEALTKAINAPDVSDFQAQKLRQQLNARTRTQAVRVASRLDQLFQTDRDGFLLRSPPVGWDVGRPGDPPAMPDAPITEATLRSTYSDYQLVSHPEPRHGGFLQVSPVASGGYVSALLRQRNYSDGRNDFPPLGARNESWGTNVFHPIDAFFLMNPSEFRTIGKAEVDGREVIVIERRTKSAAMPKGRRIEIVRAQIDPKRGGLPLRIEWDSAPVTNGPPAPVATDHTPERLLETTEITEVEGAGFYPTKGTIRVFGEVDDPPAPRVMMEESTWSASLVRANAALPATLTTIPIPTGTMYYDEYQGRSLRAGREGFNEAILPWGLCGVIVATWVIYGVFALIRGITRRARATATA